MQNSIAALIKMGAESLRESSPTARLDAEVLLGFLLQLTRIQLITESTELVSKEIEKQFFGLIERRKNYEPVAYLTGEKEFFGLTFKVSPAVLVPRPETEVLVERALEIISTKQSAEVLDLGTGSGCIAIAIAAMRRSQGKETRVVATDQSSGALAMAHENAQRLGVGNTIEFRQGEWFSCVPDSERFDLVVSNPPYIAKNDRQISPELKYEPQSALFADGDGLLDILRIVEGVLQLQKMPERVLIEIGARQAADLSARLPLEQLHFIKDLAGLDRVLEFSFSAPIS